LKCKNEEIFGIFNFQKLKGEKIKKLLGFLYMVQVGGQKHRMMFKLFYFHISFYGQTWLNLAMDGHNSPLWLHHNIDPKKTLILTPHNQVEGVYTAYIAQIKIPRFI